MKRNMLIYQALALLGIVMRVYGNGLGDISEEEAAELYDCLSTVVCVEKHAEEAKRIISQTGPELRNLVVQQITQIYEMEFDDTLECWTAYNEEICAKPEEKKKEFMMKAAMTASKICEDNQLGPECTGVTRTVAEMKNVVAEYTAMGVCGPGRVAQDTPVGDAMKNNPTSMRVAMNVNPIG